MEVDLCAGDPLSWARAFRSRLAPQAAVEVVSRSARRAVPGVPARFPAPDSAPEDLVLHDRQLLPRRIHDADLPQHSDAVPLAREAAGGLRAGRVPPARRTGRILRRDHLPLSAAVDVRPGARGRMALA